MSNDPFTLFLWVSPGFYCTFMNTSKFYWTGTGSGWVFVVDAEKWKEIDQSFREKENRVRELSAFFLSFFASGWWGFGSSWRPLPVNNRFKLIHRFQFFFKERLGISPSATGSEPTHQICYFCLQKIIATVSVVFPWASRCYFTTRPVNHLIAKVKHRFLGDEA